jgi:hypothetical protein
VAAQGVTVLRGPEVSARDRKTLEVRQFYAIPRETDREHSYELHAYFYFPRSFGIHDGTWGQEAFYRDANLFMRLHAPDLRLSELADLEHPTSPASILRRQLPMLLEDHAPTSESLDALAKMLGAELADAATVAVRRLRSELRRATARLDVARLVGDVERLCDEVLDALSAVRRLRAKARAYRSVAPPTLLPSLAFAEEYASAVVDEKLAELAGEVDRCPSLRDGKGTAVRMRLLLARTAEQVTRRRVEQGFAVPWGDAPEYFTYRLGLLKKELQRALYVDTRALATDPFYRNTAAMVAAGLAATWATLAQIPLWTGGLTTSGGMLFLGAAVGAYILKDRIKEWVRNSLTRRFLKWDHDRRIVGNAMQRVGLGAFGGRAMERVRWAKDDDVPPHVTALRVSHRTVRGVTPELEHVLHYERKVTLYQDGDEQMPVGFGVQELFRLSLDEIVKRLDDPDDTVTYYDHGVGSFHEAKMPKVYHLNLILDAKDLATGAQVQSRWRVVVNQQGIVRVDPVLERDGRAPAQASAFDSSASLPGIPAE